MKVQYSHTMYMYIVHPTVLRFGLSCSHSTLTTPFPRYHSTPHEVGVASHAQSTTGHTHQYGAREAWTDSSHQPKDRALPNGFRSTAHGDPSCEHIIYNVHVQYLNMLSLFTAPLPPLPSFLASLPHLSLSPHPFPPPSFLHFFHPPYLSLSLSPHSILPTFINAPSLSLPLQTPVDVSESALLRDVLFVFQNIDGNFIHFDSKQDAFRIDSKVHVHVRKVQYTCT